MALDELPAPPTAAQSRKLLSFCFSDCFRQANRKKTVHVMVHLMAHFHHKDRAWSLWNTRCLMFSSDIPYHVNYKRFSILSSNVVQHSWMSIKYVFFGQKANSKKWEIWSIFIGLLFLPDTQDMH